MVLTQAHPSEAFSDIYVKADVGCAQYDPLRRKLLRAARASVDQYPIPVRMSLGGANAARVSLPVAPRV